MTYDAPELRLVGHAASIVRGENDTHGDSGIPTDKNNLAELVEIGLDD